MTQFPPDDEPEILDLDALPIEEDEGDDQDPEDPGFDPIASPVAELSTVRDFVRYAVTRFNAAELTYGHGTATAYDEAVYMVLETLCLPIDHLEPYLDARLMETERLRLAQIIDARVTTRKPASYLTNRAYIQGFPFYVDERVIIPRSYVGELLFSDMIGGPDFNLVDDPGAVETVLDLCTGSGCLAILAGYVFPNAEIDAVDLSPDALEVAARNVTAHHMTDRIALHHGDLFGPLEGRRYDVILTNPPYVAPDGMAMLTPEALQEPEMALAGGGFDGMDIVRRILAEAADHLTEHGGMMCEIGTARPYLEEAFPDVDFLWLETEESYGEVFWLSASQLRALSAS